MTTYKGFNVPAGTDPANVPQSFRDYVDSVGTTYASTAAADAAGVPTNYIVVINGVPMIKRTAGWSPIGRINVTSSTRPASPPIGTLIYETDTRDTYEYTLDDSSPPVASWTRIIDQAEFQEFQNQVSVLPICGSHFGSGGGVISEGNTGFGAQSPIFTPTRQGIVTATWSAGVAYMNPSGAGNQFTWRVKLMLKTGAGAWTQVGLVEESDTVTAPFGNHLIRRVSTSNFGWGLTVGTQYRWAVWVEHVTSNYNVNFEGWSITLNHGYWVW